MISAGFKEVNVGSSCLFKKGINFMKYSILVVEQEAETRVFLRTILFSNGFDVHGAGNETEGMELIKRLNPDLVILDALLPDEGALTLLKSVNEIPVLLISSLPLKALYYRYRLEGKDGHQNLRNLPLLEKPLQEDELLELINRLISNLNTNHQRS